MKIRHAAIMPSSCHTRFLEFDGSRKTDWQGFMLLLPYCHLLFLIYVEEEEEEDTQRIRITTLCMLCVGYYL